MLRIRTDELLSIVSKKTVEKNCPLSLLLQTEENDLIIGIEKESKSFDVTTIYLDVDSNIMKQITRLLRGGNIEQSFTDIDFLNKTLQKLNMTNLLNLQFNLATEQSNLLTGGFSQQLITNENIYEKDSPLEINSDTIEVQNNIARIFGIAKPHETTELDSFVVNSPTTDNLIANNIVKSDINAFNEFSEFTANVIESISESIGKKSKLSKHKEKKSKSRHIVVDTETDY